MSFHHHELVGARMTRDRMRALRYPAEDIEKVSELVELHLRFHTYAMGWTDSAVRRYVRDAGDLLDDLNELTRADCTTRNPMPAQAAFAAHGRARSSHSRACARARSWPPSVPTWTAVRSWPTWGLGRAPWWAGRSHTCSSCASRRGHTPTRRPPPARRMVGASTGVGRE